MRQFFRFELTFSGLLYSAAILAAVATVSGFLGKIWWLFELTSHFRLQYFIFLAGSATVFIFLKKKYEAVIFGAFALINLFLIVPFYFGKASAPAEVGTYRVAMINVNYINSEYGRSIEFIRSTNPDFIVILELTPQWLAELSVISKDYPFHEFHAREGCYGIGLFSRAPFRSVKTVTTGKLRVPSVIASLDLNGRPITVIGSHSFPPRGKRAADFRDDHLNHLARQVKSVKGPTMLLADLNTTAWSPCFTKILRDTHLRDARRGFGMKTTWPSFLPFAGIAIDHCLVSKEVKVTDFQIGPNIGSDHLPLIVDFYVK